MRPREEAEAKIKEQFARLDRKLTPGVKSLPPWHYGRMELIALLDFIYEAVPVTEERHDA